MQTQNSESGGAMKKSEMYVIRRAHKVCRIEREWKKAPPDQKDDLWGQLSDARSDLHYSCDLDVENKEREMES
jgi:hypothetical protein